MHSGDKILMASKFKKEIGQPAIKGFLGEGSSNIKKKGTPPSIKKKSQKMTDFRGF